jgi:hypothetical protein
MPGLLLEVIAGNAAGTYIQVDDELVIGRHASGAGQLSDDTEISRHHARLVREATGGYAIEDLGSSNGTFVNGLRLASPQLLGEGDSIEVGATTLLVRSITARSAAAQTEPESPPPGAAATVFARSPAFADAPATPAAAPAPGAAPTPDAAPAPAPAPAGSARQDVEGSSPVAQPDVDVATAAETPVPASRIPPLTLVLEVDFEAREATVSLGDGVAPLRLALEDGHWQARRAGD